MDIKKLSDYKGEAQLGRCVGCGEFETDFHRLYCLQFDGTSICLCPDCFRKTQIAMNKVIINEVLAQIMAEIEQYNQRPNHYPCDMISIGTVKQIIDKYKAESER